MIFLLTSEVGATLVPLNIEVWNVILL